MPVDLCEPPALVEPLIDYLAKDYASFRRLMLDRLALLMPEWTERHIPDIGITLVELLAYVGDYLSYHQDAVATEAYLDTARQRISVRRHARLVDYLLHEGCNARAWVTCSVSLPEAKLAVSDFYFATPLPEVIFEPIASGKTEVSFYDAHNQIEFYTWGGRECCLPKGATSATLVDPAGEQEDHRLRLAECDVLIFEELYGPRTSLAANADRSHRHAVRITKVTKTRDLLTKQALLEIEWCEQDALPFPLCLSAVGPPPKCELKTGISVARGNVLLVDHGRTVVDGPWTVPLGDTTERCEDDCTPAEHAKVPGRFRPKLLRSDVTYASAVAVCMPGQAADAPGESHSTPCRDACAISAASLQLMQDHRQAWPSLWLQSTFESLIYRWLPRLDLLDSGPEDRHVVVEIDDERRAHLRFGDGDCGRQPQAEEAFTAHYRVGNGPGGNVGADTITRIVFHENAPSGLTISVRNPLPAVGGTAPELVSEAKLRAPHLFRHRLERAITAADYAAIVMRDFPAQVQRAAAVIRWNGLAPLVIVAVDARGRSEPDAKLLCRIGQHLERYRRIGHDVQVLPARHVPLNIEMCIDVKPEYVRGHVHAALLDALGSRKLAGGGSGFFHPDNLSFGVGVYLSLLVAVAQAVQGVESVIVTRFKRLYDGPADELAKGVLSLGPMEVARLDNDPSFPEHGKLKLVMRGGR